MLIGIDGRSGAGKTTLATELAAHLRQNHSVALFHLEDVYPGWDGLENGISIYAQHVLAPLASGSAASWPTWDWIENCTGPSRETAPAEIIIFEGVGACAASARDLLDISVWVRGDDTTRQDRALSRDGQAYAPFWDMWAAQEAAWLAVDDVPGVADILLDPADAKSALDELLVLLRHFPASRFLSAHEQPPHLSITDLGHHEAGPELFSHLLRALPEAAWLDSSDTDLPGTTRNRFSILAAPAANGGQQMRHDSGVNTVSAGASLARFREPFFHYLDALWQPGTVKTPSDYATDFVLGWVGWLGYELKRENGGSDVPPEASVPDAALFLAERAVVVDHHLKRLWLLESQEAGHDGAWLASVSAALELGAGPADAEPTTAHAPVFMATDSADEYKNKVSSCQREITEGNSYEVCLTTRMSAQLQDFDALTSYLRLRRANPAPFAAFMRINQVQVLSTSPERFLSISRDGAMLAEPIKGTRPRAMDQNGNILPGEDELLKAELAANPKDRAENVMIVDLLRNDLSHHAVPGSIEVARLCEIESYATVHQMVSSIVATLPEHASRAAAVASAFPAGSMTGAPKISTMEILDRLESGPRGIYSGALGYFSSNGASDLSVVIRTLIATPTETGDGTRLSLGVGGAVTSDSTPDAEYEEIQAKAYGILTVLGSDFPG